MHFEICPFLVAACLVGWASASGEFSYSDQDHWKKNAEWSCDGNRQSPIDLRPTKHGRPMLRSLRNFDSAYSGYFQNNGHSMQFNPQEKMAKFVTRRGKYIVQQFHLHWGRNDEEGSEHRDQGKQCSAEMHFVATKAGENNTNAIDYYGVLSILFEADSNISYQTTEPWSKIDIASLVKDNSRVEASINFEDFLPPGGSMRHRDHYYYKGSLTTPPCSETVQWTVLSDHAKIPSDFLEQLRLLEGHGDESLSHNFRDTQARNNREIFTTVRRQ